MGTTMRDDPRAAPVRNVMQRGWEGEEEGGKKTKVAAAFPDLS